MELSHKTFIERPLTFKEGLQYFLRNVGAESGTTPVRFLRYDPCPAFIIVADPMGQILRCPREDLFLAGGTTDGSALARPS